jgi:hypothetical protein
MQLNTGVDLAGACAWQNPSQSWQREFDEVIQLPDGRTLADAVPGQPRKFRKEHGMKQVQTAARMVTEAAANMVDDLRVDDLRTDREDASDQPSSGQRVDTSRKPRHWG